MAKRLIRKTVSEPHGVSLLDSDGSISLGSKDAGVGQGGPANVMNESLPPLSGWKALVHYIPEDECTRRTTQNWTWLLFKDSWVILRPALNAPRAVLAFTVENTNQGPQGSTLDEIRNAVPTTRMLVNWVDNDGEYYVQQADVPNAWVLKYWHDIRDSKEDWAKFLNNPLPEDAWNRTRELPEAPGVPQPLHPTTVQELRKYLAERNISPSRGEKPDIIEDWDF